MLKTCQNPSALSVRAATGEGDVHSAGTRPTATGHSRERCTTWATWPPTGPGTWLSPTRSIVALDVAATSMLTSRTWRIPTVITPAASWHWPSDSWSKTACPIAPRPGTYGETTVSSSPSPRSRIGSKRGEKRAAGRITQDYLDDALSDFSGYIAADELYDGAVTDRVKPSHRGSGQNQPVFLLISYTFCPRHAREFAVAESPDGGRAQGWVARIGGRVRMGPTVARRSLAAAGRAGQAGRTRPTLSF